MFENLRKSLTIFCCDFRFRAVQKCDNLVDLGKCCKMSIYLQNFMPIQPRTSLLKFGHLAVKSGKGTVLYLSTKVLTAILGDDQIKQPYLEAATKALVQHELLARSDQIPLAEFLSLVSGEYEQFTSNRVRVRAAE